MVDVPNFGSCGEFHKELDHYVVPKPSNMSKYNYRNNLVDTNKNTVNHCCCYLIQISHYFFFDI